MLIDLPGHGVQVPGGSRCWRLGAWEAMGRRGKERGGGGESVLVLTHDGDSPWLPESKPEGAAVKLHGFCSLASRAVIGGSDPCVLPARPRAVALVWSRSDARACRRTGGLDACSGRRRRHTGSRVQGRALESERGEAWAGARLPSGGTG